MSQQHFFPLPCFPSPVRSASPLSMECPSPSLLVDDVEGAGDLDAFALKVDAKLHALDAERRDLASRLARVNALRGDWTAVREHVQAALRAHAVAEAKERWRDDEDADVPTQRRAPPPTLRKRERS